MWLKRFLAIFSLLCVGLSFAVSQSQESPKAIILDRLSEYQKILISSKEQQQEALLSLSICKDTIAKLTEELTNSKLSYESEIAGLRLDLQTSQASLVELQQLSKDQTSELMQLSKDLDSLNRSLKLYRDIAVGSVVVAVGTVVYCIVKYR